jgi:hypothetical protein
MVAPPYNVKSPPSQNGGLENKRRFLVYLGRIYTLIATPAVFGDGT